MAGSDSTRRCAVLDLDDTLWGGTVGEVGVAGLVLGPGTTEGEAFQGFQRHLLELHSRGVVLAVCSKNDDDVARSVFERHPHMVLNLEHIACFVANWTSKATNVVTIARTLDLGLDALVFVDNSAEERRVVGEAHGQVAVVDLPENPAGYIRALDAGRYFR